jgi:hypothetical protein
VIVSFTGTYTQENLLRLDRAMRRATRSSGIYTGAGCFGVAALVLLVLALVQWTKGNMSGAFEWFMVFTVAAVIAPAMWWSARRSFGRHPSINRVVAGEIRDDALQIKTPESDSTLTWKAFQSSFCAPDYLLLFQNEGSIIGLAAEFFRTSDDFTAACSLVRDHVPARRSR